MICVELPGCRFNYRVAGIVRNAGRVLLHRGEQDAFWTLPGGRVESMEAASAALAREFHEELGVEVSVGRLRYFTENFFRYDGVLFHEIGLFFAARIPRSAAICGNFDPFVGFEAGGQRLIFEWVALEAVPRRAIKPEFLGPALLHPRRCIQHVVNDER